MHKLIIIGLRTYPATPKNSPIRVTESQTEVFSSIPSLYQTAEGKNFVAAYKVTLTWRQSKNSSSTLYSLAYSSPWYPSLSSGKISSSSIRVSLSHLTTEEEITKFLNTLDIILESE